MNINEIDKKFEKMSRTCADSLSGTHPPKPKKAVKKTTKAKVKKK